MSAITRFFSHVMSKQSFNARFLRQNGYELLDDEPLGEGSYAKVRRAYSRKMKLHVAIKILDRRKAPDDFLKRFLPRELSVIKLLEHPHIIRLYEVLDTGSKVLGSDVDALLAPRKICTIGLEANLATTPVTSELVVADLGASLQAKPLRQRPVLLDLLGQLHLQGESLHGSHGSNWQLAATGCTFFRGTGSGAGVSESSSDMEKVQRPLLVFLGLLDGIHLGLDFLTPLGQRIGEGCHEGGSVDQDQGDPAYQPALQHGHDAVIGAGFSVMNGSETGRGAGTTESSCTLKHSP